MNKVVLVGCGNVGMSYAYALLNQKTYVDELALIDINEERVEGEVMDLNHCLAYSPSKIQIHKGTYADCKDASLVVICAGANQEVGETRMDLIHKNSRIFKEIVASILKEGFSGIFLVASNPLDVMTQLVLMYSNFPISRVIGSGTTLDTARLKYLLSDKVGVSPKDIDCFVIGEHGDSEFIPWSSGSIAGKSMDEFLSKEEMTAIEERVRNSAYEIIRKKGATYYGIGMSLVHITSAILEDKKLILPVSCYDEENGVCISTPAVLGKKGASKIFIPLNDKEEEKLRSSISVIQKAVHLVD